MTDLHNFWSSVDGFSTNWWLEIHYNTSKNLQILQLGEVFYHSGAMMMPNDLDRSLFGKGISGKSILPWCVLA